MANSIISHIPSQVEEAYSPGRRSCAYSVAGGRTAMPKHTTRQDNV